MGELRDDSVSTDEVENGQNKEETVEEEKKKLKKTTRNIIQ